MQQDPDLPDMLGQFAAMGRSDREFVLAELGEPAAETLSALLKEGSRSHYSEALSSAIAQIRDGEPPAGMTAQAAAALEAIIAEEAEAAKADKARTSPARGRPMIVDWLSNFIAGRA